MRALVFSEMITLCKPIFALVAGVWTLTGMSTLVTSETVACCTSITALVAGERTLTGMSTLVSSEMAPLRASIIAFVTIERAIAVRKVSRVLVQRIVGFVVMNRFIAINCA